MNVTINAVNFEMAEKLEQFIEKKMNRFERHLSSDWAPARMFISGSNGSVTP